MFRGIYCRAMRSWCACVHVCVHVCVVCVCVFVCLSVCVIRGVVLLCRAVLLRFSGKGIARGTCTEWDTRERSVL